MNYRESERIKAVSLRDYLFDDPGFEIYHKQPRPFVLKDAEKNLWEPIRMEAIRYFKENQIVWWPGSINPSGHMLSSQVSCINHLFFLRNDKEAALAILKGIVDNDIVEVCDDFEGGYIGFEVTSNHSYLDEVKAGSKQTRGANCTSVDALMTGVLRSGKKIQVLIEWKYTEYYSGDCRASGLSGVIRKSRYDRLITDPESPIKCTVPIDNLYYEPFYQIMRQTLLAWQMVKHSNQELNADDWLHFDVIPENNLHLRYRVLAPDMMQSGIEIAWKANLKEPHKYNVITPQKLLQPLLFHPKYKSLITYLNKRYW